MHKFTWHWTRDIGTAPWRKTPDRVSCFALSRVIYYGAVDPTPRALSDAGLNNGLVAVTRLSRACVHAEKEWAEEVLNWQKGCPCHAYMIPIQRSKGRRPRSQDRLLLSWKLSAIVSCDYEGLRYSNSAGWWTATTHITCRVNDLKGRGSRSQGISKLLLQKLKICIIIPAGVKIFSFIRYAAPYSDDPTHAQDHSENSVWEAAIKVSNAG